VVSITLLYGVAGICAGIFQNRLNVICLHWAFISSVSAYLYGILSGIMGVPPFLACLVALAALVIIITPVTLLRLKINSHNFTILTFALVMVWQSALMVLPKKYGGVYGISGVPELFGFLQRNLETLILSLVLLIFVIIFMKRESTSRIRVAAELVSDNPYRAKSLGANCVRTIFVYGLFSALTLGLFGIIQVSYVGFVGPRSFDIALSIIILSLAVAYSVSLRFYLVVLFFVISMPDLLKLYGLSGSDVSYMRLSFSGLVLIAVCLKPIREYFAPRN